MRIACKQIINNDEGLFYKIYLHNELILLAEIPMGEAKKDSLNMISYKRLEEDLQILQNAVDQDGRRFNIVRIPAAETMTAKFRVDSSDHFSSSYFHGCHVGDTVTYILASSYLNFLITNNAVLMPSYWKEGRPESMKAKDEKAKAIMKKLFPDRKIIQINVEALNHGGRGFIVRRNKQAELQLNKENNDAGPKYVISNK